MCGIFGAVSQRNITKILLEGLRRLEYRGYDSAGMAVIDAEDRIHRIRICGKVQALADAMDNHDAEGKAGIAHTRWATHGKPSEHNAHPHVSHNEIAVVHNGIIENHEALKKKLIELDYQFTSETDTEVAAHLIHYYYQKYENLLGALQHAAQELEGAFALGVIHENHPHQLAVIRKGSPLVIGFGVEENFIASDSLALRGFAQSVIYLEEGDCALLESHQVSIYDKNQQIIDRIRHPLEEGHEAIDKTHYRHYMLKEIHEQTIALTNTLEGRVVNLNVLKASFGEKAAEIFPQVKQIHIVACGTSYHAGMVAKYWIESLARIPTQVEIASEYRYREVVVPGKTLFIAVSQSGETADTLAALRKAKLAGYFATLAICNVPFSTLTREADCIFLTRAGVEIGVASTKAFTTQLAAFLMLAASLCQDERAQIVLTELCQLPRHIEEVLKISELVETLAYSLIDYKHMLFLGRGVQYPVALEGALKLKEISYIHAEGYPAGELKHGPLALVDKDMPVIAIAPNDDLLSKLKSNLHEVSAREGQLIVFVDAKQTWSPNGAKLIPVPTCAAWIAPIIYTIPLQLLAYYVAVAKGTDVDQPRNLAKSVTVE